MTREPGTTAECRDTGLADDESAYEESADEETAAALAAIRERADAVRNREVERALATLEGDDLSAADRAPLERLADRLVARLVAVPERALCSRSADEETVENARELFG